MNKWLARGWQRFIRLMEHPLLGIAMVVGNTIGGLVGYPFWYGGQLAATPPYLWVFVPDSPTSALLFVPAYLLIRRQKPGWPLLNAVAAFANLKYGIWTVAFWYLYWQGGGEPGLMGYAMSFTHAVMALEGVYLLHYAWISPRAALGVWAWFLLHDWADYGPWRLHPGLPSPDLVPAMQVEAVLSTVVLGAVLVGLAYRRRRVPRTVPVG